MRNLFKLIAVFIISILFISCGNQKDETRTNVKVTVLQKLYDYTDNNSVRSHYFYEKINVKVLGCEATNFSLIGSVEWKRLNNGICDYSSYAKDTIVLIDNLTLPAGTDKDLEGLITWETQNECSTYGISWEWIETTCEK